MLNVPRLVVSATRGGLGKTTISLGIIAAWRGDGKQIAPYKKGPDFIDAGWLSAAAGRPCYNLDLFLMEENSVRQSFLEHSSDADAALIEGNRGLFDGVDEVGTYSTARLAKALGAPVLLIVDCTKSSSTVAAVVLGCQQFDSAVTIGGIILNNVGTRRQESVIRRAIEQNSSAPVVGAIPRLKQSEFPERHMGLTPFQEHPDVDAAIAAASAVVRQYLDLEKLWKIAGKVAPTADVAVENAPIARSEGPVVGVIRDRAFQFYYPDNLEALERAGARIREVNALADNALPDVDALYIGGGFPETQAAELAANRSFCSSLRTAAEAGMPMYAECGGLIYLGRTLRVGDTVHKMTSVLPADFVLETRPQAHGYTVLDVHGSNPFFDRNSTLRGHEFHYSRIVNVQEVGDMAFSMQRGKGIDGSHDGLLYKNVLATYTHIHALGTSQWAPSLVEQARRYQGNKRRGISDARA